MIAGPSLPEAYRGLERCRFGDSPALAERLAALIVAGRKTATVGLLAAGYETHVGQRWIVDIADDRPVAVIETTELFECALSDVPHDFAAAEGEGDRSFAWWKAAHEAYFRRTAGAVSEDTMLICERFRLVAVLDDAFAAGASAIAAVEHLRAPTDHNPAPRPETLS